MSSKSPPNSRFSSRPYAPNTSNGEISDCWIVLLLALTLVAGCGFRKLGNVDGSDVPLDRGPADGAVGGESDSGRDVPLDRDPGDGLAGSESDSGLTESRTDASDAVTLSAKAPTAI